MPKGIYNTTHSIECLVCKNSFNSQRENSVYCGNLCRNIAWRSKNKDRDKATKQKWISNNKDQHRLNQSSYQSKRSAADPVYLLKRRLRARLGRISIRSGVSHIKELNCSVDFLKAHIEGLFYGSMTWENYGSVWEIDHIMPLQVAKNKKQLMELCVYTNLQPLLVEDHVLKTSKENSNV